MCSHMHVSVHTLGMSVYTWVCVFDMLMFSFCAITDAVVQAFWILCFRASRDLQISSVETHHFDNKATPLHIMTCFMAHECIKSTN